MLHLIDKINQIVIADQKTLKLKMMDILLRKIPSSTFYQSLVQWKKKQNQVCLSILLHKDHPFIMVNRESELLYLPFGLLVHQSYSARLAKLTWSLFFSLFLPLPESYMTVYTPTLSVELSLCLIHSLSLSLYLSFSSFPSFLAYLLCSTPASASFFYHFDSFLSICE